MNDTTQKKSEVYAYLEYFTSCDDLKLIFQFVQESRTEQIGRHFHYVNLKIKEANHHHLIKVIFMFNSE